MRPLGDGVTVQVPRRTAPTPLPSGVTVSVVVPCFNYGRFLPQAVESALAQRDVNVEVVVIDDASTDDSVAVGRRLASVDPRVRLLVHPENRGHLRTANEALLAGSGEFIVKLDADDVLTPGTLARSAALLRACPGVGFVYGRVEVFSGSEPPRCEDARASSWTVWAGHDWLARVLGRAHNVIAQPEVMIRRSALEMAGPWYSEDLPWAEDYNLWLRLAARGDVGRVNGCSQGLYRVHSHSIQRAAADIELADLRARVSAVRLFLQQVPDLPTPLSHLALASLARDTRRLAADRIDRGLTDQAAQREYLTIARQLEDELDLEPDRSPLTWAGPVGRIVRRLYRPYRWRRWRMFGI